MMRRAKIIATIGPASQNKDTLTRMVEAGMDVARLNLSHGNHADHQKLIKRLREVAQETGKPLPILQDLQGQKIRLGDLARPDITLVEGQPLTVSATPVLGDERRISIDYPHLAASLQPGKKILIDDGRIELLVEAVEGDLVRTRVLIGGQLKPHKGVNLPGCRLDLPTLTPKDEADLAFGLQQGVDVLAISFVRSAGDVSAIRQAIVRAAPERAAIPLIAKIERPEALDDLEAILEIADGVMVARGDLGVELPPQVVPVAQKKIIAAANQHAKIVITATQMLESMIDAPRPTRAEASDVANAIFDGSDDVMLSGETAVGRYPVQAIAMMDAIIREAEANSGFWGKYPDTFVPASGSDDAYFITRAARELAHDRNVAAIAVFTKSGRTALLMSKARPIVDILAFTPNLDVCRRLNLLWGVNPHLIPHAETIEGMLSVVEEAILSTGSLTPGQQVVLVCGYPVKESGPANMAFLHTVRGRVPPS
ncbi:MAG: pyruvate kinase [Anaerolineales bacterium]|nr:pyruvate kinase [Anaerolineales bacterium]